jgi:hypothetical protein
MIGASVAWSQDAADKEVQAGIVFGYGMNFQKMETKYLANNGIGSDLTIGANVNFSFTETIGLCTGVEFDFETLKFKTGGDPVYYEYNDNNILTKVEREEANLTDNVQLFQLTERKQKPIYLTIPTMLTFRTNFIGYFRYFGKFGLRTSFLLSNKINDEGFNFDPDDILGVPSSGSNSNMSASNNMFFMKSAVGAAGGAEWNFVGSTTLMAEIGYYYGFTPLFNDRKEDKTFLWTTAANNGIGNDTYFNNLAKQSQLMLKLSVLF